MFYKADSHGEIYIVIKGQNRNSIKIVNKIMKQKSNQGYGYAHLNPVVAFAGKSINEISGKQQEGNQSEQTVFNKGFQIKVVRVEIGYSILYGNRSPELPVTLSESGVPEEFTEGKGPLGQAPVFKHVAYSVGTNQIVESVRPLVYKKDKPRTRKREIQ